MILAWASPFKKYIIIYVMRIRRTADRRESPSCKPLQTDFGQFSDLWQTSDKLLTDFRRQPPTSDFGPRPDFEHQTSDFGLLTSEFHTSDLRLRTDFQLQTSEFELQTVNFRLRVRILDFWCRAYFGQTSSFRFWTSVFEFQTLDNTGYFRRSMQALLQCRQVLAVTTIYYLHHCKTTVYIWIH